MKYLQAKFLISAEKYQQCPGVNGGVASPNAPGKYLPEFALVGRSNVGKSSFINALANQKKLAKTSNTPGKTRLINFFNFSDKFIIADLPGYGYAKVSKEEQNRWQKNLEEYLTQRESIVSLVQFIDARHPIQKNDYQMREWIMLQDLPVITVVTKIDYAGLGAAKKIEKELGGMVFPFSATEHRYNEKVLEYLLNHPFE